ncbi:membrane protein [Devosia epidermidihirudinis]|uniref:Membrane protein n=1 Tax=Devosia epidermidihirudinis TaxID=1293439 RepID=A0A0F5QG63_9HYPH|nr:YitT family protein [Devosia epidermidihirudinis]KKC39678.1 membrane protein [Devosia epidermidihirudinis]
MTPDLSAPSRHKLHEDIFAMLIGTMLVSLGIVFYAKVTLTTGSTAGLALLLQYATNIPFGWLFFAINLPFYVLAFMRMGWPFAVKTIACVALVSYFTAHLSEWLDIVRIEPLFAALVGGGMIGLGILSLFRHKASVGGINILALYLQDNFGIRAGYFQLGVDALILIAAFFILPLDRVLYSVLGALVLNLIVATNHKPGRYVGFS